MKAIFDYFTSETFGFLLKLLTGVAAAGFGIFGIGTKTRDDNGKLTGSGWTALIGIIVAGVLAIGTSIYEFTEGAAKAKLEQEQSNRLLLSVQRGLYPLHEMKLTVRLHLSDDFPGVREYKNWLKTRLAKNRDCKGRSLSLKCAFERRSPTLFRYSIPASSGLFPRPSTKLSSSVAAFYLQVSLYEPDTARGKLRYKSLGKPFRVLWPQKPSAQTRFLYDSPEDDLFLEMDEISLDGDAAKTGGVYSLADISPGMIAMALGVRQYLFCGITSTADDGINKADRCRQRVTFPLFNAISLYYVTLSFPFPKHIEIGIPGGSIDCPLYGRHFKASLLPGDVEIKPGFPFQRLNIDDKERDEACDSILNASRTDFPLDDEYGLLQSQ